MWYVTMIDTFMSGWGMSRGKKNLLIFECENIQEATAVSNNASNRGDQSEINTYSEDKLPEFDTEKYYISYADKETHTRWYKPNSFKKGWLLCKKELLIR